MRSFKSQLLDEEINLLLNLRMQREQIAEKIALLEQFRMEKDAELLQREQGGVQAAHLNGLYFYLQNASRQIRQLEIEREEADRAVERQLQVVVAASQEVMGLNKLEEKQRQAYRYQASKEIEREIAEYVTGQLNRPAAQ